MEVRTPFYLISRKVRLKKLIFIYISFIKNNFDIVVFVHPLSLAAILLITFLAIHSSIIGGGFLSVLA
jgi:hypothetical protein